MAIKAVIDTNVLVSSLSSRSVYHWLVRLLLEEKIDLFVTDEIMLEYEEVLKRKYSAAVAGHFISALKELPNVHYTHIFFRWALLKDEDDNKFTDCYIASAAHYLVSNDSDFAILKSLEFPKINVVRLEEFALVAGK
jgi:uncharacterized protein